jgi:hypothetical protein
MVIKMTNKTTNNETKVTTLTNMDFTDSMSMSMDFLQPTSMISLEYSAEELKTSEMLEKAFGKVTNLTTKVVGKGYQVAKKVAATFNF